MTPARCPLRKLRQVEIAVRDVSPASQAFEHLFALDASWDYAAVDAPLHMRALRAGSTFLELVAPLGKMAPPARFIARHGEGLYFPVIETDRDRDQLALELLGRRVHLTGTWQDTQYRLVWVHPKAATGVALELGEVTVAGNPWTGGDGPGRDVWHRSPPTGDIETVRGVVIVVPHLPQAVARWRHILGMTPSWTASTPRQERALLSFADGDTFIELRQPVRSGTAEADFVQKRGAGLFAVVLEASDPTSVERRARDLGAIVAAGGPYPGTETYAIDPAALCGVRVEVVNPSARSWLSDLASTASVAVAS